MAPPSEEDATKGPAGPDPTAIQLSKVGHATLLSSLAPSGAARRAQSFPPSVVVTIMAWPGPPRGGTPPPTATQSVVLGQEIPRSDVVVTGSACDTHWSPPSSVVKTLPDGDPSPGVSDPTTKHSCVDGHEMPCAVTGPTSDDGCCGSALCAQLVPPSDVISTLDSVSEGGPPTATHCDAVAHATRTRLFCPAGTESIVQLRADDFISATPVLPSGEAPTAMQNATVGQETSDSSPTALGRGGLAVQLWPPSEDVATSPR